MELSIDRFEGDRQEVAVLMTDDGRSILFPRDLLPRGTAAGERLKLTLERDQAGTKMLARQARKLRQDLKKTDPGGDISL